MTSALRLRQAGLPRPVGAWVATLPRERIVAEALAWAAEPSGRARVRGQRMLRREGSGS